MNIKYISILAYELVRTLLRDLIDETKKAGLPLRMKNWVCLIGRTIDGITEVKTLM